MSTDSPVRVLVAGATGFTGALAAHLVANGVTMLSEEMDYISRKLRLFEGPESITLELVQWGGADASG